MSFVRFLAVLALSVWVGGLVALGGVASTLFGVLERQEPAGGRELAGAAFGAMLDRFQYGAWIAGGLVLLSMGLRAALGPRPRRFGIRMTLATAMLAASVVSVAIITPRIDAIRTSVPGSIAALPDRDDRKGAFGRWHALSTSLMLLTIVTGVGLLWAEAQDTH